MEKLNEMVGTTAIYRVLLFLPDVIVWFVYIQVNRNFK